MNERNVFLMYVFEIKPVGGLNFKWNGCKTIDGDIKIF